MIWGAYTWESLPAEIKKAFEILGYSEEIWNTGGQAFFTTLKWMDLTVPQQEQAQILGYTPDLWDTAQSGDYNMVTGKPLGDIPPPPAPMATVPESMRPSKQQPQVYDDDDSQAALDALDSIEVESNGVTLFFAYLCMMMVGILNWLRQRQVHHMWMIQGGVFGILSTLMLSFSDFAALLLQTVAVHCFLLQAFFMVKLRKTIRPVAGMESLSIALWGADIMFAAGAFTQVVLVYWLHADGEAYYDVNLAKGEVVAAWFWFFTGVIYTINTMFLANQSLVFDDDESVISRTLTITRQHPNGDSYTIRPAAIQLRPRSAGLTDAVIT